MQRAQHDNPRRGMSESSLGNKYLTFQASMQRAQHDDPRRGMSESSLGNPYFVTQLQNVTVTEGETITLRCAAAGQFVRVYLCVCMFVLRCV